ncbi:hypothetical protein [Priestia koreensis]|uniref:hypothetical protein n=1 Tax=Priestia koreensis TaxID=284581 RepID=UPI001F5A8014|nr:hypothetical protein [Priestia koreensis]UNL87559.1 hypothetical protein IE339_23940 [Priestia koreensis]
MKKIGTFKKGLFAISATAITLGALGAGAASASTAPKTAVTQKHELTQKQKEGYYKKYAEIIKAVNAANPGKELTLVPFKQFKQEDWVTPEQFKKIATERVNMKLSVSKGSNKTYSMSSVTKTKSKTISSHGVSRSINVTGNFNTSYDQDRRRNFFVSCNSITTKLEGTGSWSVSGTTKELIDSGRTYAITIGGKYTLNGISSSHQLSLEFYCNADGSVG